ncbi:hypothetical protein E2C01_015516 [Portunus trituberculatus]|uniref:Uncharacterized protein n=1 Tax=Portunus trituberculatus TaxID=210409 RepID=A0A5B7DLV7_PORTR|nr:hypothetical protein [Portunus trituberculatus]
MRDGAAGHHTAVPAPPLVSQCDQLLPCVLLKACYSVPASSCLFCACCWCCCCWWWWLVVRNEKMVNSYYKTVAITVKMRLRLLAVSLDPVREAVEAKRYDN